MCILLDIDGVMLPAKGWAPAPLLDDGFICFEDKAVKALKLILNDDSVLVLTTSHKSKYSIDQWKTIFSKRGLDIDNIEKLDDNVFRRNRKDEIIHFLEAKDLKSDFVIIDDDQSLNDLPPNFKHHLVLTKSLIRLTINDLKNKNLI